MIKDQIWNLFLLGAKIRNKSLWNPTKGHFTAKTLMHLWQKSFTSKKNRQKYLNILLFWKCPVHSSEWGKCSLTLSYVKIFHNPKIGASRTICNLRHFRPKMRCKKVQQQMTFIFCLKTDKLQRMKFLMVIETLAKLVFYSCLIICDICVSRMEEKIVQK